MIFVKNSEIKGMKHWGFYSNTQNVR